MRTFPRCWVFPGGGVDEGETLTAAARRELQEETGLEVSSDSLKLLCIWESVFPTSSASCLEMGQVKGHAVTVFVEALVEQDNVQNVVLQASECSAYTWVPLGQLINWHSKDKPPPATLAWIMLPGWRIAGETVEPHKISAIQLQGIYPNLLGEGIGQGHLYALAKLAERESRESTARSSSIGCTLWNAAGPRYAEMPRFAPGGRTFQAIAGPCRTMCSVDSRGFRMSYGGTWRDIGCPCHWGTDRRNADAPRITFRPMCFGDSEKLTRARKK